jgi:hypothetical protein
VVTFENVVTTTLFVSWLWAMFLAAKKAQRRGFEAGTPIPPDTRATVQRSPGAHKLGSRVGFRRRSLLGRAGSGHAPISDDHWRPRRGNRNHPPA